MTPREAAAALGGEPYGGKSVLCSGPGHNRSDRSLSVTLDASAPDGFLVHSFAGDDWRDCRDYVRARLGLARETSPRRLQERRRHASALEPVELNRDRAIALWRRRKRVVGTLAELYLRDVRKYRGPIPDTIGFLPATRVHPAAVISAYGVANEPDTGKLVINDSQVRAVHLTKLAPSGERISKITLGRGAAGSPIIVAPLNGLRRLVVTEGIEDALSVHAAEGLGAWAAGCAGFMPALAESVPTHIEHVMILADDNKAGYRGARGLAVGLLRRGIPFKVVSLGATNEAG